MTASAAPWVDMHHSLCKRKANFDRGNDVPVLDGSLVLLGEAVAGGVGLRVRQGEQEIV